MDKEIKVNKDIRSETVWYYFVWTVGAAQKKTVAWTAFKNAVKRFEKSLISPQ